MCAAAALRAVVHRSASESREIGGIAMRRKGSVLVALSMIVLSHAAVAAPLSPRIANYRINAGYDGKTHIIDGRVEHAILLEIFTDVGIGTQIAKE